MKIDTRYTRSGDALVDIVLQTAAERALSDDQLARVGCNQDRLIWNDDDSEVALPLGDPGRFPFPAGWENHTVTRDGDRATVAYAPAEEHAHGFALAIAATLAIAFGSISELRYNDLLPLERYQLHGQHLILET